MTFDALSRGSLEQSSYVLGTHAGSLGFGNGILGFWLHSSNHEPAGKIHTPVPGVQYSLAKIQIRMGSLSTGLTTSVIFILPYTTNQFHTGVLRGSQ